MAQDATGKLSLELMDTNNKIFTESPFYIKYNFLKDNTAAIADVKDAMIAGIGKIVDLTNNSLVNTKVTYEVNIVSD